MAHIIFLHGASSSGKSTIARALQAQIEKPFWHVSIDHLRDAGVLPRARFQSGEFDWSAYRGKFFDAFHASLGAYADAGNHLILEHILDTDGWAETLHRLFAGHDVLFVGIHCPLHLLEERERQRKDRPVGSAARDFRTIHAGRSYDLEIDGQNSVGDSVAAILAAWRSDRRQSEFAR